MDSQYEEIKRLLKGIPNLPGWGVTYDEEIDKETMQLLAKDGYRIKRVLRNKDITTYKIKPPL